MPTDAQMRDAYFERQREIATGLLALPMAAESIETRATFRMTEDVRMPDDPNLRVLALSVSAERFLGTEPGRWHGDFVPGEAPHPQARALVRALTRQGRPRKNENEYWTIVPSDIVPVLLGRTLVS
jgi:hypothetical protein